MFNRNKRDMMSDATMGGASSPSQVRTVDVSTFSKVINWLLAGLIFLTPLLFLPFTTEVREFNKQTLVFLGVLVMLGVWVMKILITRKVTWVKTSLDYILLAYTLIYVMSSFLSLDKASSFLGYYGRFTGGLLSVVALVVLYYIVVNNVRTAKLTQRLVNAILASGALVLVYTILQMFHVYIFRFSFAKSAAFNTIGSLSSLSIFAGLMIILAQWAWVSGKASRLQNVIYAVITIAGLLVMFFVNSFVAWLVLALGMIIFLAMSMVITANKEMSPTWIWKPLLVLVISVLFVGFQYLPNSINPRSWVGGLVNLPLEIQLSNGATFEMVKNALTQKPILGYGPGTTGIAFGEIKPERLNQSVVWNLNFDRASSEIANIAIETGLLGLLAFEATSILFLFYALYFLLKRADHPGRMYAFGLFMLWLSLYITHFMYFFNGTFYFLFWLSLALFMAVTHWSQGEAEEKALSFTDSPRSSLSWMFASLLMLAVLLVGGFFQIAVYFADTAYAAGLKELSKQGGDLDKAARHFDAARSRNQYRDVYQLAYGQNMVLLASREIRKEKPDISVFQNMVARMIAAGNNATALSPNKASNWAARSQFFSQIRALNVPGTDDAIINSAEEAVKKDSNNPILYIQLGQAYANAAQTIDPKIVSSGTDTDGDGLSDENEKALGSNDKSSDSNSNGVTDGDEVKAGFNPAGTGRLTSAQMTKFTKIDQDKLRKAEEALKKAKDLKGDLPDTYVALGRVYEQWGKMEDAKKVLEEGVSKFRANADMKYELGRIQFNLKSYAEAEKLFNDTLKLVPNHANAHYSLGLVAIQKKDFAAALKEFEKTLEIVGTNADLENVIKQLKEQIANPAK